MKKTYWQNHQGRHKGFHFRVFGYGLAVHVDEPPRFSERVGAQRVLRLSRLSFYFLHRREVA